MTGRPRLAMLPTPCEPADRLGAALGLSAGQLLVKRDDLTGLAGGGNKARKLELLVDEALAEGCDTLITGGGRQSNHARMTAAAASRLGLSCTLVLASDEPSEPTGNVVLDELLGATILWVGPLDYEALDERIEREAVALRDMGRRPYAVPVGGASPLGTLAYVQAADELRAQLPDLDLVVVADGSGGTHAGLAAGLGQHGAVLGVDVGIHPDLETAVSVLATAAAGLAGRPAPAGTVQVDHDRFGAGYGEPTPEAREAMDLAARLEGLILDPVYTAKGLAGLIAAARDGRVGDRRTVFVHTGGMPALFTPRYARWVRGR
jgi:D-cysteine desulfhydrase